MTNNRIWCVGVLSVVLFAFGLVIESKAQTREEIISNFCLGDEFFVVNSVEDVEDMGGCESAPGNCTLREAINAANLCPAGSPGEIRLEPLTYSLRTLGFANPIFADRGPQAGGASALPIHGDIIIHGNGAIIERGAETPFFRIFEVRPGARLVLRETTVRGGHTGPGRTGPARDGGGIFVMDRGTLSLYGSIVEENKADAGDGGGILNRGLTRVHASTVRNNIADGGGGGIRNWGRLEIIQSTISGNSTLAVRAIGGAVDNAGEYMLVKSSTFSGNRAQRASAIYHLGSPRTVVLEIRDSTIFNNDSTNEVGRALEMFGGARITNTIVANNTPRDCLLDLGISAFESHGVNFDSDGTCGDAPGLKFNFTTDPMLLPLANYGGPTETHPPAFQSPVVDAAVFDPGESCDVVDQRFLPRPKDGDSSGVAECDIGAVEILSIGEIVFEDIADVIRRRGSPSEGLIRRRLFGP